MFINIKKERNWQNIQMGLNKSLLIFFLSSSTQKSFILVLIKKLKVFFLSNISNANRYFLIISYFCQNFFFNELKTLEINERKMIKFLEHFIIFLEYLLENYICLSEKKRIKYNNLITFKKKLFLKIIKNLYVHGINLFNCLMKKNLGIFFTIPIISYFSKSLNIVQLRFLIFEKLNCCNKHLIEKMDFYNLKILYKNILKNKQTKFLIKLFLFDILNFFFLLKKVYIQDKFFSLSIIESFFFNFNELYKILIPNQTQNKHDFTKLSIQNINKLRKKNFSPCLKRIFRLLLEHLSVSFRDFFITIKNLIFEIFLKVINLFKKENDFFFFINQKILRNQETMGIFYNKIIRKNHTKYKNENNLENFNSYMIYPTSFFICFKNGLKSTKFYSRNVHSKCVKINKNIEKIVTMLIIQSKKRKICWEFQIYFLLFIKFYFYIDNLIYIENINYAFLKNKFFNTVRMNNLLTLIKIIKSKKEDISSNLFHSEFYLMRKIKTSNCELFQIIISLFSNLCIFEGKSILLFLYYIDYLLISGNIFSKILGFISITYKNNKEFLKRCLVIMIWYIFYLKSDIVNFFFIEIYNMLLKLKNSDLFTLCFFLEICSFFFISNKQSTECIFNKMIKNQFLFILLITKILKYSKREKKFENIILEKFAYFLSYFSCDPCINLERVIKTHNLSNQNINSVKINHNSGWLVFLFFYNIFAELNFSVDNKTTESYLLNKKISNKIIYIKNTIEYFFYFFFLKNPRNLNFFTKRLFVKIFSKNLLINQDYLLLTLYICFSSIETEIKTHVMILLGLIVQIRPFLFYQNYANIFQMFKDEDFYTIKMFLILYLFFLKNNYLKLNQMNVELIMFIKHTDINIHNYSKKIFNLIRLKNKISFIREFTFSPSFISERLLSDLELKTIAVFYFNSINISVNHKLFVITLHQWVDVFKCVKTWMKINRLFYELSFFGLNLNILSKILIILIKYIKNDHIYNQLIKILIKIKSKKYQIQKMTEEIFFQFRKDQKMFKIF